MRMHSYAIGLAAAFVSGIIAHSVWVGSKPALGTHEATPSVTSLTPTKAGQNLRTVDQLETVHSAQPKTEAERMIMLQPAVVDAILSGGGLDRKLSRMGLSPDQMAAVSAIQRKGVAAIKQIEKDHAKPISDAQGEYVSISPFPVKRAKWLGEIEADLRSIVDDDRSAIIARLVAFADNDEAVGVYRREIFVTEPQEVGRKMRIEERTFAEDGQHIDSDYESVDSRSQSRWGHLLDFPK